jgi:hypothetical protein
VEELVSVGVEEIEHGMLKKVFIRPWKLITFCILFLKHRNIVRRIEE